MRLITVLKITFLCWKNCMWNKKYSSSGCCQLEPTFALLPSSKRPQSPQSNNREWKHVKHFWQASLNRLWGFWRWRHGNCYRNSTLTQGPRRGGPRTWGQDTRKSVLVKTNMPTDIMPPVKSQRGNRVNIYECIYIYMCTSRSTCRPNSGLFCTKKNCNLASY